MWTYFFISFLFFITITGCHTARNLSHQRPAALPVNDRELIPEGIAVHPETGTIFLSSIAKKKVVTIAKNGDVSDIITSGSNGFMQGLGMKFSADGRLLWVCSAADEGKTALFCIDPNAKTVVGKYTHDSARFFNDLVIANNGDVFLTDSYQGAVFHFNAAEKKITEWLRHPNLTYANGIALSGDEKILIVASGRYGAQRIETATKRISSISRDQHVDYAIDGMVLRQKQLFCVIGWPQDKPETHRVIRYHLSDDHYFLKADTLAIGSMLKAPTTAAESGDELLVLGNTGLDLYNAHKQQITEIKDSLTSPLLFRFKLNQ